MKNKIMDSLDAHFRQWQEIAERVQEQLAPALKAHEALHKSLEPIMEAQKTFQKALEPILAQQEHWRGLVKSIQVPRFELPDLSHLTKQAAEFQRSIQGLISPAFEQLQKSFRALPPRTREALLLLGSHGWYLDLGMPLPGLWELKKALSEGNVREAEDDMRVRIVGVAYPLHRSPYLKQCLNAIE